MKYAKHARTIEDKKKRKQLILDTAWQMFIESKGEMPIVSKIAKKISLSKGAIYNYFNSKEEIFLNIVVCLLEKWGDDIKKCILKNKSYTSEELADIIISFPLKNQMMLKLITMINGFEYNESLFDSLISTKIQSAVNLEKIASVLQNNLKNISSSEAIHLFLKILGLIIGTWQIITVNEKVKVELVNKGLNIYNMNIYKFIKDGVVKLIS